jgi:general secretion pathway protein J
MKRCAFLRSNAVRTTTPASGFTLVEILIAVAIFGILAAMSYRALTAVLETRQRVDQENKKWRTIAFAVTHLEQDIGAAINRPVRDASGLPRPALVGNPVPLAGEGQLMLTRGGELDASGYETPPLRVGYVVRDGVLFQLNWAVLDQATHTEPTATPLLSGIQRLEFAYAAAGGQPTPFWPQSGNVGANPLPAAIAMRITFNSGEQLSRMFAIAPAITQ